MDFQERIQKTADELIIYSIKKGVGSKIQPYISEKSRVLDAGCGKGHILNDIKKVKKTNKFGIDIYNRPKSAHPVEQIPKEDFEFVVGDLNSMPFRENSFDLIINSHVIEHLKREDGERLLKSFSGLLNGGGTLYIQTPNRDRLTKLVGDGLKKIHLYEKARMFFPTERKWDKKQKKFYETHPKILTHEYEYGFNELAGLVGDRFEIIESGGLTFNWFAFVKPIAVMRLFLPWGVVETGISYTDRVIDFAGLNSLKSPMFVLAKGRAKDSAIKAGKTDRLVSILIPIYNEEKYLQKCIDSLLGQTHKNTEIMVLFDRGTTDASRKILRKFGNKIKVLEHEHTWVSKSLNLGIKKAKGEVIFFVEGDCIYAPDCVESAVKEFNNPSVGGVAILPKFFGVHSIWGRTQNEFQQIRNQWFLEGVLPLTWCYFYKADMLKEIGNFNEAVKQAEDQELAVRIKKAGYRIVLLPEVLRHHAMSDSLNSITKIARTTFRTAYMHAIQRYAPQPLARKFAFFFSLLGSLPLALAVPGFALLPAGVLLLAYAFTFIRLIPYAGQLSLTTAIIAPALVIYKTFFYCSGMLYGKIKKQFVDVSAELREM